MSERRRNDRASPILARFAIATALLLQAGAADAMSCPHDAAKYINPKGQLIFLDSKGNEHAVAGIDPDTIAPVRDERPRSGSGCPLLLLPYIRDKKQVFYEDQLVEGADPESFVVADWLYPRDRSAVFSRARKLTERLADFRRLPEFGDFATDGVHYYCGDMIVTEPGFEIIHDRYGRNSHYARTSRRVFHIYNCQVVQGADPGTARLSTYGGYLVDAKAVFHGARNVDRDPSTFVELEGGYSKDANGVYWYSRLIPGADPGTFVVTRSRALGAEAEDETFRYREHWRVCRLKASGPPSASDRSDDVPSCQGH
jgi:hypothetical protein